MTVLRVLNHIEFEAEIDTDIGDIVRTGDIIALVTSIREEEPDYVRYMSDLEREEIRKYLPDIFRARRVVRCISLCTSDLKDVRRAPKVGDRVEKLDDEEIRKLHYDGEFRIPYLIPLMHKTDISTVRTLVMKIMELIPEERDLLEIILSEIEYNRMRGVEL
jgi:DNA-directed RNA polymerase subunit F